MPGELHPSAPVVNLGSARLIELYLHRAGAHLGRPSTTTPVIAAIDIDPETPAPAGLEATAALAARDGTATP